MLPITGYVYNYIYMRPNSSQSSQGETVSVKLKLATFEILQRSKTVSWGVSTKMDIEAISHDLLTALVREKIKDSANLVITARLLGFTFTEF